jgi:hypothetical protein
LDLPRSTLIDVTETLPLPPFALETSPSYIFRQNKVNLSTSGVATSASTALEIDEGIKRGLKSFNQTCRTLSLTVAIAAREAVSGTSSMELAYQRSPQYSPPVNQTLTDPTSTQSGLGSLFVAQWLVQIAEEHAGLLAGSPANSPDHLVEFESSIAVPRDDELSIIHAITALHRLSPLESGAMTSTAVNATSPIAGILLPAPGSIDLDAAGLRLAIRAMELVLRGSRELVRDALLQGGGPSAGVIDPKLSRNGMLKLVGECKFYFSRRAPREPLASRKLTRLCIGLTHCYQFLDFLANSSARDNDIYNLVTQKTTEILDLTFGLNSLRESGLGPAGARTRLIWNRSSGFGILGRNVVSRDGWAENSHNTSSVPGINGIGVFLSDISSIPSNPPSVIGNQRSLSSRPSPPLFHAPPPEPHPLTSPNRHQFESYDQAEYHLTSSSLVNHAIAVPGSSDYLPVDSTGSSSNPAPDLYTTSPRVHPYRVLPRGGEVNPTSQSIAFKRRPGMVHRVTSDAIATTGADDFSSLHPSHHRVMRRASEATLFHRSFSLSLRSYVLVFCSELLIIFE